MSAGTTKSQTCPCKPMKGEGIRWLLFMLGFRQLGCSSPVDSRFRGNDGVEIGGAVIVRFNLMSTRPRLFAYL